MSANVTSSKKVLINSVVYTCSGLLQKCFGMFLLPLYTAYLTTEDYGIQSIANSFINTMSFIAAFSLFSAVLRFYVDLKEDEEKLKRFYGSMSLFVFLSSIGFGILLTIFRAPLSRYVFSGVDYYPVILVCLISLVFSCQHTIYGHILRSQQRAVKASVFGLLYFLTTVCLNIVLVVGMKMGAVGVLVATAISNFLYTAYFVIEMSIKRTIRFCLDWGLIKEALKYSIPIIPHNLSTNIAQLISKVFISGTHSLADLGVYTVAVQFGHVADTIQTYVNSAYGPWLYENLKEQREGYKANIRKTVKMIIMVIGLFLIGIVFFAQDYILLFVNEEFAAAWRYVPFIVAVYAIKTVYYFYVNVLFYHKEASRKLFIATLSSSFLDIVLAALLIPCLGVYGSILAEGIAMLLRVSIVFFISTMYEKIGLYIRDFVVNFFVIIFFMSVGLAPSFFVFGEAFSLVNFAYKLVVIGIYCLIILGCYRREVLAVLKRLNRKMGHCK